MRALLMYERRRRPSRLADRRREKFFAFTALSAVLALSFFTLLAYLSQKSDFLISNISVEGNSLVTASEITERAEGVLSGSYFWFFPRKNSLIFPKRKLVNVLEHAFPALDSVKISRASFSSLVISAQEREPFVLWCPNSSETAGKDSCYFADQNGFIFFPSPDFSSGLYVRFIGQSTSSTPVGGQVFPPERFREFSHFLQSIRDLGLSPVSVTIEKGIAGTPDYTVSLDSGVRLLLSGSQSLEKTLENMTAFFAEPETSSSSAEFFKGVSYIDFRFENKVFYKSRGE